MKLESGIVLRRSSFMVLFFDSLFVCLLVSPFLSGCRIAKSGKDLPSDQPTMQSDSTAAKPPLVQPQRQTGATSPAQALPIMLDSNGNEKGRTVLRLDYFAPP
ncbi:MAG: hypothetical protein NTV34_02330, partial [Proteobacteria bacterium]|nr:hypothetical protein [Pseudomonadota bacterium]